MAKKPGTDALTPQQVQNYLAGLGYVEQMKDRMALVRTDSGTNDMAAVVELAGEALGAFVNCFAFPEGVAVKNGLVRMAGFVKDLDLVVPEHLR